MVRDKCIHKGVKHTITDSTGLTLFLSIRMCFLFLLCSQFLHSAIQRNWMNASFVARMNGTRFVLLYRRLGTNYAMIFYCKERIQYLIHVKVYMVEEFHSAYRMGGK